MKLVVACLCSFLVGAALVYMFAIRLLTITSQQDLHFDLVGELAVVESLREGHTDAIIEFFEESVCHNHHALEFVLAENMFSDKAFSEDLLRKTARYSQKCEPINYDA